MDRIFIRDLRVEAVIGILERERLATQPLIIDMELGVDIRTPAASRDIADALDYAALTDAVCAFIEASDEMLIETLAERICDFVLKGFGVPWMRLVLCKPEAMPGTTLVGVDIERGTWTA